MDCNVNVKENAERTLTPVNSIHEGEKKCWHHRKGVVATFKENYLISVVG